MTSSMAVYDPAINLSERTSIRTSIQSRMEVGMTSIMVKERE